MAIYLRFGFAINLIMLNETLNFGDKQLNTSHKEINLSASRDNNFNVIRLLLAVLVLLSHSSELIDNNRHREPLIRLFGTVTLGEVAVDGFFALSGFLILKSWQRNPNVLDFLKKRILRIYPAFIVASLVCALIVGPLGSNTTQYFGHFNLLQFFKGLILLYIPIIPPVFVGQPHPSINGSVWTISYEFRCYLFVVLLGIFSYDKRRSLWLILSVTALVLSLCPNILKMIAFPGLHFLFGGPADLMRFLAFFCTGGCFYLYSNRIKYKNIWALTAAIVLPICMFRFETSQLGLLVFGVYILFWFAQVQLQFLERFRKYPDISYGVYLYGWPVQKLLLWYIPSLSPWLLFFLACGLSFICGLLSWSFVERPFLRPRKSKL